MHNGCSTLDHFGLVVTTFAADEYVFEALRAGASGFLLRNTPPERLAEAIRLVQRGDALVAPKVTSSLIEASARTPHPSAPPPEQLRKMLTPREIEVLTLMASGLTIAETLVISKATAKPHVTHILTKLGLRDRTQAVILAYESGLVEPPGGETAVAPRS